MASESDPVRRVPSLVSYCQRVLSAHADAITCLGDDIRYDVIRPVLECCSADTLLRLEQSSPYLEQDTSDLWEHLCFKSYPLLAEQLDGLPPPESWRDQYFLLREAEAHRLEEVALRLRNQRIEAAERKREREVKLTDRLPPAKRSRSAWGTPSQPKSLFQKTKSEATKLRRSLYTPRLAPKSALLTAHPTAADPPVTPTTKPANSRTSIQAAPLSHSSSSISQTPPRSARSANPIESVLHKNPGGPSTLQLPSPPRPQPPATESRPSKPPIQKKNPMASLFMPKHRASSQLPSQSGSNSNTRSMPAR